MMIKTSVCLLTIGTTGVPRYIMIRGVREVMIHQYIDHDNATVIVFSTIHN